jgi:hypothetical protein
MMDEFSVIKSFKKALNQLRIPFIRRLISNKIIVLFNAQKDTKILAIKYLTTLRVRNNAFAVLRSHYAESRVRGALALWQRRGAHYALTMARMAMLCVCEVGLLITTMEGRGDDYVESACARR